MDIIVMEIRSPVRSVGRSFGCVGPLRCAMHHTIKIFIPIPFDAVCSFAVVKPQTRTRLCAFTLDPGGHRRLHCSREKFEPHAVSPTAIYHAVAHHHEMKCPTASTEKIDNSIWWCSNNRISLIFDFVIYILHITASYSSRLIFDQQQQHKKWHGI